MTKDVGLRIRLDARLRRDFIEICRVQDRSAAQVIREFMRDYIEKNFGSSQEPLFPSPDSGQSATIDR
jgi:hypothetical protein